MMVGEMNAQAIARSLKPRTRRAIGAGVAVAIALAVRPITVSA
jgi:hypothetical protein